MKKLKLLFLVITTCCFSALVPQNAFSQTCIYEGKEYSKGSIICMDGYQYQCDGSSWNYLGIQCGTEIYRTDTTVFTKNAEILKKTYSPIKRVVFSSSLRLPCISMYYVSFSQVGLRNNCGRCTVAVVNWLGVGVKYYRVEAYNSTVINIESSNGQIIGEQPCQ